MNKQTFSSYPIALSLFRVPSPYTPPFSSLAARSHAESLRGEDEHAVHMGVIGEVLGEAGKERADFQGASCFRTTQGRCTRGQRGHAAVGMSSVLEGGKVV